MKIPLPHAICFPIYCTLSIQFRRSNNRCTTHPLAIILPIQNNITSDLSHELSSQSRTNVQSIELTLSSNGRCGATSKTQAAERYNKR